MYKNINGSFLYFINYQDNERELCKMEMRCLFNREINEKYFFSDIDINASKSPFIKSKIKIIYSDEFLDRMVRKIKEDNLSYDDFKVSYVKSEQGDVQYEDRLEATRKIGFVVNGYPDMNKPRNPLAVTKINVLWIFGEYERNYFKWQKHNDKPYSYSNAIPLRMARALVNIATCDDRSLNIIDPCCGVGTVVIEALDLGFDVKGYEISKSIACNARNNIEYLGYNREIITSGDMHDIKEKYDVAIVDIPYGLYSPITVQEQVDIINTSRRIARRLVIITFEDMDNIIISAGFRILDKCYMTKGNMKREISICE